MATYAQKMASAYFVEWRGQRYPVLSLKEASAFWDGQRDGLMRRGIGHGSAGPLPHVLDWQGKHIGHISWNGRIWAGWPRDWKPTTRPLYDNRT